MRRERTREDENRGASLPASQFTTPRKGKRAWSSSKILPVYRHAHARRRWRGEPYLSLSRGRGRNAIGKGLFGDLGDCTVARQTIDWQAGKLSRSIVSASAPPFFSFVLASARIALLSIEGRTGRYLPTYLPNMLLLYPLAPPSTTQAEELGFFPFFPLLSSHHVSSQG